MTRPPFSDLDRAHSRRDFLAVGSASAAALLLAACGSSSSGGTASSTNASTKLVPVRIPDDGNSGVLAVGKKDGSLAAALAAAGGQLVWTGSGGPFAPAAQEMDADALDFAQGSITSAVGALAQSPQFKLFAQVAPDALGEGILVKHDSPITDVQGLVGKKVAVNQGGTGEYLLLKALANAGIPASKVTRVYLNPQETAPVFDSGQVDAWATWSSYSIALLAQGARFVARGGQFGSQNYAVWAVRSGFAQQNPRVVKALYDYLHTSTLKEIANPSAYVNVETNSGPQALNAAEIKINDQIASAGKTVDTIGAADEAAFNQVAQFFAQQKVTPTTVNVSQYVINPT